MKSELVPKNVSLSLGNQSVQVSIRHKNRGTKTVLALHGLQSNQQIYDALFSDPSYDKFSILTLDFLGFGASDKPESSSYDLLEQAQIVTKVLAIEGIEKVNVLGHSLGGMVGTLLLDMIPNQISKLISIEGNLTLKDCGESLKVSEMPLQSFYDSYDKMKEEIRNKGGVSGPQRADWMKSTPAYAFYETAKSLVEWSRSEKLMKIFSTSSHQKLLIIGEESSYHSRPNDARTTIRTIPNSGHFLLQENPRPTLTAIKDFLG